VFFTAVAFLSLVISSVMRYYGTVPQGLINIFKNLLRKSLTARKIGKVRDHEKSI